MDSRASRQRRGGAGGHGSASGALPSAVAVPVGSEGELRGELERVVTQLAPSVDWTLRVDALLRLEGLAKGGGPNFAAFPDLLAALLRDPLAAQMQERRSAVSRQACHCIATLAATCRRAFEPLAMHLLPVVFKTLAMGIHIVSEAADACAQSMLAHCPSPRLLPKLLSVLGGDKNGRLRQAAADYLLLALEAWEPCELERQLEGVERALLAAASDAQAETRATGRAMYGAYARTWPAQAAALLARMSERDRSLQEKLAAAAADYAPGLLPEGSYASQGPSRRSSLGNSGATTPRGLPRSSSLPTGAPAGGGCGPVRLAPVVPKLSLSVVGSAAGSTRSSPTHPTSARSGAAAAATAGYAGGYAQQAAAGPGAGAAGARENQPDNQAPAGQGVPATPRSMFPKTFARREAAAAAAAAAEAGEAEAEPARQPGPAAPAGRERLGLRRSLGGAALRMSVAAFRREMPGDMEGMVPRAPLPPLPCQLPLEAAQQQQQLEQALSRPLTARRVGGMERQASGIPEDSEVSSLASWDEPSGLGAPAPSLAPLLAGLGKPGVGWADKVTLYQAVQSSLEQCGASQALAADVASNSDRLVASLLDGSGDAHFRVAAAALAALGAGLAGPCSRVVFEAQLDRVLTTLFARVVDPKEQIRQLVGSALAAVLHQHTADATLAALARSLQANRAPKVKCAVMGFFALAVAGPELAAGGEGDGGCVEEGQAAPPAPLLAQLTGSALHGLLRSLLQLATDKNPEIRRAAAEAVAAVYHGGEAQAVLAQVHALPPADVLAVQRAIGPAIQQRLAAAPGSTSGAPEAAPSAAAAGRSGAASASQSAPSSRRQSGEGAKQQRRGDSSQAAKRRQDSQPAAPAAPAAAAQPQAQQQQQQTPEPPSPFAWHGIQSFSPRQDSDAAQEHAAAAANTAPAQAIALQAPAVPAAPAGVSELAPFDDVMADQLHRLLAQLEGGEPSREALQGLSRLAHVLPASAWPPCFDQVMGSLCRALDSEGPLLREAGLMLARDLSAAAQPSLFLPALPALLPRLLACAADQGGGRELSMAADEALEQLLARAPPQSCLGLLTPRLPAAAAQLGTDRQEGAHLHATIRSLRRVVGRMQPAGLATHLQPLLVPGLCAAFRSPLADVRKATVDSLVAIWQVVGDALKPHLEPLSASQMKLLAIYVDKSRTSSAAS